MTDRLHARRKRYALRQQLVDSGVLPGEPSLFRPSDKMYLGVVVREVSRFVAYKRPYYGRHGWDSYRIPYA